MPRATVDGVGLQYELAGEGRRGDVALLNGIAMSIGHWKPIVAALVDAGYRVLCHDMRGQLLSEKPEGPYSLELHARDLARLLDGLGIGAASIVGTSYGAEVGLCFARDFPARTRSLALIDGVSELDAVLEAAADSWKRAALLDHGLFYRTLMPWNYSPAWLAANRAALESRAAAVAALPEEYFQAFARLCDAFLRIDLTKDLGAIAARTLVAVGTADILKPPRFSRIMAGGIAGALYREFEGAGHAVVIERPAEVAALLLEFLGA